MASEVFVCDEHLCAQCQHSLARTPRLPIGGAQALETSSAVSRDALIIQDRRSQTKTFRNTLKICY